ncbi:protein ImuA [Roseateles sp. YR242]|uniref:translesion DNA synthesis-associated protein ImuA n=1 Tax=Roseateles sp. YR242 TaxID=1855305 RepID=UPI0008BE6B38|nr:translesion DNA synthesis-associated protein ImuA [Roseateles sp. YR242]SEK96286.1 protein ImuA [Roseateles sp. YR242]
MSAQPGLLSPSQNAARPDVMPLPANVAEALWRGDAMGRSCNTAWSSGFPALDAELPDGGWPSRQITEILQPQFSLAEWRLIGPALREVVSDGAAVVLVGAPKRPHLPGLMHLGLGERQLVWIQAQATSERLWCTEQLIKSNAAGAVLAWLPQAAPEQLRRLQVLAQSFDGPVFLFRPIQARHDPSPAPLRVAVDVDVDWQLQVTLLKRKGPAHEQPVVLPSIPGGLELVLTPRVMHPSDLRAQRQRTPAKRPTTATTNATTNAIAVGEATSLAPGASAHATTLATPIAATSAPTPSSGSALPAAKELHHAVGRPDSSTLSF